jgi:hypothetical protein
MHEHRIHSTHFCDGYNTCDIFSGLLNIYYTEYSVYKAQNVLGKTADQGYIGANLLRSSSAAKDV